MSNWFCAFVAAALALTAAKAIGDDGSNDSPAGSSVTRAPKVESDAAKDERRASSPKALPTRRDKYPPLPDSLKERCRSNSGKSWDAMTADARAQAQRVRAACSGF